MRDVNLSNTYSYYKEVIPEHNEIFDAFTGAKLVNNLYNTYGVIGTISFITFPQTVVVKLQLYKMFTYAPSVFYVLGHRVADTTADSDYMMYFTDIVGNAYNSDPYTGIDATPLVRYMLYYDRIIFKLNNVIYIHRTDAPTRDYIISPTPDTPLYLYYRIHGV